MKAGIPASGNQTEESGVTVQLKRCKQLTHSFSWVSAVKLPGISPTDD